MMCENQRLANCTCHCKNWHCIKYVMQIVWQSLAVLRKVSGNGVKVKIVWTLSWADQLWAVLTVWPLGNTVVDTLHGAEFKSLHDQLEWFGPSRNQPLYSKHDFSYISSRITMHNLIKRLLLILVIVLTEVSSLKLNNITPCGPF